MYNNNILKNYREQEVMTSHPIKNTILIYEKCISKFRLVRNLFEKLSFKEGEEHLVKLESVFFELKLSINEAADEKLAEDLHNLYDWVLSEIHEMKMVRNADRVAGIEVVLNNLIEAYEGVLKQDEEGGLS